MPSFQESGALKALYDPLAGTVNFTLLLKDAGKITAGTKAISFVVRVGEEFIEASVSAAELQALITADDQKAIVYKLAVSAIPPVVLIYYAIEQNNSGNDTKVSMDSENSSGKISLYGAPGPLSKPEIITKSITQGGDNTKVNVVAQFRLALPDNTGGAKLSTYNLTISVDDVIDLSVINQVIGDIDIKNKYVLYNLSKSNIEEGKKIVIAYNVDNTEGVQSKLSPALVIVASFKPAQPSFTAESGKRDNVDTPYIPLKIYADISLPNWSKLHILRKKMAGDNENDGDWVVARTVNRDGSSNTSLQSIDSEINSKGFYDYNLYRSRNSPVERFGAFKKYEFAVVLSDGDYVDSGIVTQSKRSESQFAVTGTKKFAPTATTTSKYFPQSSSTAPNGQVKVIAAFHRFTHTVTGFSAPVELVVIANLLQNGVQVDTKTILVAKDASTSGDVVFDRLATLVKSSDKFKIAYQVKASINAENLQYVPQETQLNGRPAVMLSSSSSDEVVPQPLPTDFDTALKFNAVDDVINAAKDHRRLLVELEMLQHSNDEPYKITSYDLQVSTDPSFAVNKLVALDVLKSTTQSVTVSDFSKKITEAVLIKKFEGTLQQGTAASANYQAAGGEDLDAVRYAAYATAYTAALGSGSSAAAMAAAASSATTIAAIARAEAASRNDSILNAGGYVGPQVGIPASDDYAPSTVQETTFPQNTKLWLRVATNHTWIGGGDNNIVQRPWVVYEYKTAEEDSIVAPPDLTVVQQNTNTLKVTFPKATATQWDQPSAKDFIDFVPKTHKFELLNEVGQLLQTKYVSHDDASLPTLSFNFDLKDSDLDEYVRITHIISYVNANGVSVNSDVNPGVEKWLAAKLVIKSIQIIESALKIKMLVEIDQGRSDPTTTKAQAVIPHLSVSGDSTIASFIADLTYDSTLKKFATVELVKQTDPQLIKYGLAAKYFVFANGENGQMVSTVYPM